MDVLGQHLLVGFVNLVIGVTIGWFARGRTRQRDATAAEGDTLIESVSVVLDELRRTMADQVRSWDSLRMLLADDSELTRSEIDVHVNSNRSYSRLLKSYGERLEQCDPQHLAVSFDFTDDLSANRDAADNFADSLERLDPNPLDVTVVELLRRLAEMEDSNRSLREDLDTARRRLAEQSSRLEKAEAESLHDDLTELPNRRAFERRLSELQATNLRYGRPFSLLMIDLDSFKDLNDAYGHQAGDAVLKVASRVMENACRTADFLCRYGGEEFTVLTPETNLNGALELAERIRRRMEQSSVIHSGSRLHFTCSVGVAQARPDRNTRDLVRAADEALYAAKDAGKNAVRAAESAVAV